jgi:hypothetical protein
MSKQRIVRDCDSRSYRYYQFGQLHREDGPAIQWDNGDQLWSYLGHFHRLNGPAIDIKQGNKEWFLGGGLYRNGGGIIDLDLPHLVIKEWWVNGKYCAVKSQEEFERLLKMKAFW